MEINQRKANDHRRRYDEEVQGGKVKLFDIRSGVHTYLICFTEATMLHESVVVLIDMRTIPIQRHVISP